MDEDDAGLHDALLGTANTLQSVSPPQLGENALRGRGDDHLSHSVASTAERAQARAVDPESRRQREGVPSLDLPAQRSMALTKGSSAGGKMGNFQGGKGGIMGGKGKGSGSPPPGGGAVGQESVLQPGSSASAQTETTGGKSGSGGSPRGGKKGSSTTRRGEGVVGEDGEQGAERGTNKGGKWEDGYDDRDPSRASGSRSRGGGEPTPVDEPDEGTAGQGESGGTGSNHFVAASNVQIMHDETTDQDTDGGGGARDGENGEEQ